MNIELQPIIVRESDDENGKKNYVLIDGERRLEAARGAGKKEIMALIAPPDVDPLEMAILLNMQRAYLLPIEGAEALKKLIASYEKKGEKLSQEDLAKIIGYKSKSTVSDLLKLDDLPDNIKDYARKPDCEVPKTTLVKIARLKDENEREARWKEELEKIHPDKDPDKGQCKNEVNESEKKNHRKFIFDKPGKYSSPDENFLVIFKKKREMPVDQKFLEDVLNAMVSDLIPGHGVLIRDLYEERKPEEKQEQAVDANNATAPDTAEGKVAQTTEIGNGEAESKEKEGQAIEANSKKEKEQVTGIGGEEQAENVETKAAVAGV